MGLPRIQTFKNVIAKYIESGEGRRTMAAKMTPSLRRYRDYSAVGRKAFLVEDLEDGALPIYDKDPIVPAYAVGEAGDSIQVLVNSERIFAPLYELATWPLIPLTQIRERRYDLIKRTIELGVAGIKEKEDVRVFATMNALAADADNPHQDIAIAAPLTADAIADGIAAIEEHGLRAARIFINGRDYSDIRKFDRDVVDQGWVFNPQSLQLRIRRKVRYQRPDAEWVGKVIARIGKAANIEVEPAQTRTGRLAKYASAHDLRRSCGERLRNAGVPPLVICRVMRHSSWETTRKHYAPGDVQKDAEVLNAWLSSTQMNSPR